MKLNTETFGATGATAKHDVVVLEFDFQIAGSGLSIDWSFASDDNPDQSPLGDNFDGIYTENEIFNHNFGGTSFNDVALVSIDGDAQVLYADLGNPLTSLMMFYD